MKEIIEDYRLFKNDLAEYQSSIEGHAVITAYAGDNTNELKKALAEYWEARNQTGLHYAKDDDKEQGKKVDEMVAVLFKEVY